MTAQEKFTDLMKNHKEKYKYSNKIKGIDISYANINLNYSKLYADGCKFAIMRCGATGWTRQSKWEDAEFQRHFSGAKAAGIKVGVYYYCQCNTKKEAEEEANYCLSLIKGKSLDLPVFMDYEDGEGKYAYSVQQIGAAAIRENVKIFKKIIKDAGYAFGYYGNWNYLEGFNVYSVLEDGDVVMYASPDSTPTRRHEIHQYNWKGRPNGCGGWDTDMDYMYYNIPQMIIDAGLNGNKTAEKEDNSQEESKTEKKKVTVQMNYLTYPFKTMNITQTYNGGTSHRPHSTGNPKDYPIDDDSGAYGRQYMYCPCNEMELKYIQGPGGRNGGNANSIFLESTSKVILANGQEDYVGIWAIHSEDDDIKAIKIGQKFKRGEKIVREGNTGYSYGNHIHMAVGKGKLKSSGSYPTAINSNGKSVLATTNGPLKPEDAFYIDKSFTTGFGGYGKAGLNFQSISKVPTQEVYEDGSSVSSGSKGLFCVGTDYNDAVARKKDYNVQTSGEIMCKSLANKDIRDWVTYKVYDKESKKVVYEYKTPERKYIVGKEYKDEQTWYGTYNILFQAKEAVKQQGEGYKVFDRSGDIKYTYAPFETSDSMLSSISVVKDDVEYILSSLPIYRIRADWNSSASQLMAFSNLSEATEFCKKKVEELGQDFKVFDNKGKEINVGVIEDKTKQYYVNMKKTTDYYRTEANSNDYVKQGKIAVGTYLKVIEENKDWLVLENGLAIKNVKDYFERIEQ